MGRTKITSSTQLSVRCRHNFTRPWVMWWTVLSITSSRGKLIQTRACWVSARATCAALYRLTDQWPPEIALNSLSLSLSTAGVSAVYGDNRRRQTVGPTVESAFLSHHCHHLRQSGGIVLYRLSLSLLRLARREIPERSLRRERIQHWIWCVL